MFLRVSSIFVASIAVLLGSDTTQAGQHRKRAIRCPQPAICVPAWGCGTEPCPSNGSACAPSTPSNGEWRTEKRTRTIERVLPNGQRVQETQEFEVRRLVPTSELIQEQQSEIDSIKKQLNETVQLLDEAKANKKDVNDALDKKQDKTM